MADTLIKARTQVEVDMLQNMVNRMANILAGPFYSEGKKFGNSAESNIRKNLEELVTDAYNLGFCDGKANPDVDPFSW